MAAVSERQLASIAGTVVNASTGEPLKKAQVTLDKDGDESDKHAFYTITDATGHFSIERITPGRYALKFTAWST